MTPERLRTIRRLALSGVALVASLIAFLSWVAWVLFIEGEAVAQGGDSTLSRVLWGVWATDPGAVLLVVCVLWALVCILAGVLGFLGGHFFWQRRSTYDAIRGGRA